jgi:hypothetical protein
MNRFLTARPILAAAIAFGTLAAASAAHARTDVYFSVGVPAPVYVAPQPVYVQPEPVYVQPQPVYVQPQPVYHGYRWRERHGAWGDADRDGVPNFYDRDSRYYNVRATHRGGPWGDADGDGVRNRYDRAPLNPYRR